MRKNLLCPNLSHTDAQFWISKLGIRGFYRTYIENGYDIPSIDNYNSDTNNYNLDTVNIDEGLATFLSINPDLNKEDYDKLIKKLDENLKNDDFVAEILKALRRGSKLTKETKEDLYNKNAEKLVIDKRSMVLNLPQGGNQLAEVIKYQNGTHVVYFENDGVKTRYKTFKNTSNDSIEKWIDTEFNGAQDIKNIEFNKINQRNLKKVFNKAIVESTDDKIKEQAKTLFKLYSLTKSYENIDNLVFKTLSTNAKQDLNAFVDNLSLSDNTSVEDMILINKEVFNAVQQSEIVDNIVALMYDRILSNHESENKLNLNSIFNDIYDRFNSTYQDALQKSDNPDEKIKLYYTTIANRFKNVINNFDSFYAASVRKLNSNGFKVKDKRQLVQTILDNQLEFNDNTDDSGDLESADALYRKLDYSDEANFALSSKDTASAHLKQALSLVPQFISDSNGTITQKTQKSYLNMPIYEGIDTIWGELLFKLNSVPIGSKLTFLKESGNPKYLKIAELIESNPNTKIRNEFESVFSKQYANFITIKISKPSNVAVNEGQEPTKTRTFDVFNTNRNSADDILFDDWHENFKNKSELFTLNEETGDLHINSNYIKELNKIPELFKNFDDVKSVEDSGNALLKIAEQFNLFGINISPNTILESIKYAKSKGHARDLAKIKRNYDKIFNSLYPKRDSNNKLITNIDDVNPFYTKEIKDGTKSTKSDTSGFNILTLARLENRVNPVIFEASFITGDGKSKYAFSNNTYLTHAFNRVKNDVNYLNKLSATSFAKHSIYLDRLLTDPHFKSRFELFYLDSLGNNSKAFLKNKQFKEMNEKEKEFARISLYMNNGVHADQKQYSAGTGIFLGLIPSDKTTHPAFKAPKLNTQAIALRINIIESVSTSAELPQIAKVGDAYISTDNNTLYFRSKDGNWKARLKDGGYTKEDIGTSFISYDINDNTYERIFRKLYMAERARITSTLEKIKTLDKDDATAIRNYHNGSKLGTKFLIFPELNNHLFNEDGTLKSEAYSQEIVKAYLNDFFSKLALDQNEYWKSLGLTKQDINNKNYNFKKFGHKNIMTNVDYSNFMFEYSSNQFVFMMNQMQLFSGDIALHDKKNLDGAWVNFFKRMAKDIAPGLDYNFFEKPNFTTIVLKDFTKASKHFEHYKKVLGKVADEYGGTETDGKLNVADAQEYTTLDEHIQVMKAGGRLDDTKEVNEAVERLRNGTNTEEDIRLILPPFQPMKPVYAEMVLNNEVAEIYYIKSSSIPLIPSLTKGTEIDKLRLAMENHKNSKGQPRPINRAVYESAIKLGTKGTPVDLFTQDGKIKLSELPDAQVMVLPRSGFRIQMELPNHGVDGESTESTQARKLIHNNMHNDGISRINGNEYNNKVVKDKFNELHYYNMIDGYKNLLSDLGFDNKGVLVNATKMINLLKEEGISKGYSINDLNSIQVIFEGGKFKLKVPLALNGSSEKFQAILNSLVTNRVIKQNLPGFTAVQASSAGFKMSSLEDYKANFDSNNITFLDENDTELNYARVTKTEGKDIITVSVKNLDINVSDSDTNHENILDKLKEYLDKLEAENPNLDVHPYNVNIEMFTTREEELNIRNYIADRYSSVIEADIIVPNYLGNINMKEYIKDGKLDTSKIPEELLTLIGIRIPTQGHNSMLKFKVKGFLSTVNGEMAIVPEDIVIQMGADFDVDKLFIYRYEYVNKNGVFSKVDSKLDDILSGKISISQLTKAERNNAILDLFVKKLSEGSIVHQLLLPNGFGKLPTILKDVQKYTENNNIHNFTTRSQNNIHGVNNDGKVGVAVFSLFSTFNRKLQDVDTIGIKGINVTFEDIALGDLSGLFTVNGQYKSDVILYLQSAAVDNSKEQILGVLNINDKTINVAGTMALLGLDEEYIAYFLSQPAIKSIVSRLANNNDSVSLDSEFESLNNLIQTELQRLESANISAQSASFTLDELKNNLKKGSEDTVTDYKLLKAFLSLTDASRIIGRTMSVVNMDSDGLGSTFAASFSRKAKADSLFTYPDMENAFGFRKLFENNREPATAALNILNNSISLYSNIFDFYSQEVQDLLTFFGQTYNINITEDFVKNIFNSLKSYIYSDSTLFNQENLEELRHKLLYSEKDNIATRFANWASHPNNRNLVAKRIKSRSADKKGMPNTLISVNTKATSSAEDINRVTSHFYAMLTSDNKLERDLAEDMVTYHYLIGGTFSPTSIGKYLNNDILNKYNFSGKLRNGMNQYLGELKDNRGNFVLQFFQNNPRLIKQGNLSDFNGTYSKGVLTSNVDLDLPVISLYDDKNSKYALFVKQSDKIYFRLPTVEEGNNIKHYTYGEGFASDRIDLNYINNIKGYTKQAISAISDSRENTNLNDMVDTNHNVSTLTEVPVNGTNKAKNIFNYSESNSAREVLEKIASNTSVPMHLRNIAKDFLANFGDLDNIKLGYTSQTIGTMSNLNLSLNVEKIGAIADEGEISFEELFAKEFMHEILHGATAFYLNPLNIGKLDVNQRKAVARLKDLHRLYVQNYKDQNKLNKFIQIYNKYANSLKNNTDHNLTNEEIRFFNQHKQELYGYVSVDEFISEGMTNPEFRSKLESNNFWTKLVEALRKLLRIGRTDLEVMYDSVNDLLPYTRIDTNNLSRGAVNSNLQQNTVLESRMMNVLDELANSYQKQADAFSNEYGINEGDELYPGTADEIMQKLIRDGEYSNLLVRSIDGEAVFFQRDMPTVTEVKQAILMNYNNETNFNVGTVTTAAVKNKDMGLLDKFSYRYLTLLRQRRDFLKAKIKAHQNKFGNLTHMEAEAKILSESIFNLSNHIEAADGHSFSIVLDLAETKIASIKQLYDSNSLNAENISDAIKYLNTIVSFNRQLNLKEGIELNDRLDSISSRANDLNKRLLKLSSTILNNEIKRALDLDIDTYKLVTNGSKDISGLSKDFMDFSNVNNTYIQSLGYLIERKQFDTGQELREFSTLFKDLINKYESKYNKSNLDEFLQKDKDGKWTGNFISKYSAEYYMKRKVDPKFKGANTKLVITAESRQRYEDDRRNIELNYPAQLKAWDRRNNLKRYEKSYYRGIQSPTATTAHRYFIEIPHDKWIDPKWQEINALPDNDPKKELYSFMYKTLKDINSRNHKDNNYLGDFQKSNKELLLEGNVKGSLGALHQDLKTAIDNNELILTKDVDAITGDIQMVIPVRYFEGKLIANEKTTDLAKILEATKAQDIALKHKYEIEPILMLYQNIINNSIEITDAKRNPEDENFVEVSSKPKNMSELSLFMIQNYLYNFSRDNTAAEKTYGKYVDMASHYLRIKGMGWNPFSAAGNLLQSITSNLGLAAGNQYFNMSDYNYGLAKALSTFTNSKESKKIEKLFDILDLQPIVNELMFDKSRILNASNPDKLNALDPMFLTQKVEMFNQSHTMISLLHNMKIKDKDGVETSIYEAFDDNGTWNVEKFGNNIFDDPNVLFKTQMKLRKIIIDVHGNYVRPMKAKTNFMKRAILVFRTWLPQAINSRFGSYVKDDFTETESEGRYKTTFNLIKEGKIVSSFKSIWNKDINDLTKLEIANFRRTMAEMIMIAGLWAVALMMKHMVDWDDMDDEAKMALTYQMNMLGRAQNDLLLFMNPATFKEMTKDPVPMGSIITDVWGVFNGVERTLSGNPVYKTGSRKGQSVLVKEFLDLIPFVTQIDKNISYSKNLFSDRN